jgi:hypothetical protein
MRRGMKEMVIQMPCGCLDIKEMEYKPMLSRGGAKHFGGTGSGRLDSSACTKNHTSNAYSHSMRGGD